MVRGVGGTGEQEDAVPSQPSPSLDVGTSRLNIVLNMPSVCDDRSGWKSSQAVVTNSGTRAVPSLERKVQMVNNSRPGAVPSLERSSSKVNMVQGEGGSCVNTHTGTVRVAASQGNIVLNESGGESSSVNTHTGSVRVAASQSNIVNEEECVSKLVCPNYAKQVNVKNGENMQAELNIVACGDSVQDGVGCKMSRAKHECDMLSSSLK